MLRQENFAALGPRCAAVLEQLLLAPKLLKPAEQEDRKHPGLGGFETQNAVFCVSETQLDVCHKHFSLILGFRRSTVAEGEARNGESTSLAYVT